MDHENFETSDMSELLIWSYLMVLFRIFETKPRDNEYDLFDTTKINTI